MNHKMYIWAKTDIRGREENQDSFLIDSTIEAVKSDCEYNLKIECADEENEIHVVMVADGVGGVDYGKEAAIMALKRAKRIFDENKNRSYDLEELAGLMVDDANEGLISICKQLRLRVATTLSILLWNSTHYCIANIGDSPIYLYRDDQLMLQSEIQTVGSYLRKIGKKAGEVEENQLESFIGHPGKTGREMVHIVSGRLKDGDAFILCTDGLTKCVSDRKLVNIMKKKATAKWNHFFWNELEHTEKGDNCTVIVLQVRQKDEVVTSIIDEKLGFTADFDDLEEFWKEYHIYQKEWRAYLKNKVERTGISKAELYKRIDPKVKEEPDWLKKNRIPANRDEIVFLGIASEFVLKEINEMLIRAGFNVLYAKDLHDAVLIFMIENKSWKKSGESVKALFTKMFEHAKEKQQTFLRKQEKAPIQTGLLLELIRRYKDFDRMLDKLFENNADKYKKLRDSLNQFMNLDEVEDVGARKGQELYCNENVKRIYRNRLENFRKKNIIPSRIFLIAYAVQRAFNLTATNHLLESAGMAPLYSKDIFEHLLIFALKDPELDTAENNDEDGQLLAPDPYDVVPEYLEKMLQKYVDRMKEKGHSEEMKMLLANESYMEFMRLIKVQDA